MIQKLLDDPFAEGSYGQLRREEREVVFACAIARAPSLAVDIGTFLGGGSTFFLASAAHLLGRGRVVTIEIDKDRHDAAKRRYREQRPHLLAHVEFRLGNSPDVIRTLPPADLVVCDGGDRLADAVAITETSARDAWLLFHDWDHYKERAGRQYLLMNGWTIAGIIGDLAVLTRGGA